MLVEKHISKMSPGTHSDGGGLYLRISPKGKRTWLLRTQVDGGNNTRAIGTYPLMTLAMARRYSKGEAPAMRMGDAIKAYCSKLQVKRPEQVLWLLKPLEKFPLLAGKKELVAALQTKAETAPTMANRMLTRWQDFYSFCEQNGWVEGNPLLGVQRKFIGGKEKSRNRVLSWEELESLFANAPIQHVEALLFILLTGLRPSEALWVLKTRQTVDVPTKTTLHTLPRSHLIHFVMTKTVANRNLPASDLTLSNALRRKGCDWRPHDLRRTFVTRLNDLGVAPYVVEKLVNHKLQGVMAVYNHAEYWPERHAAQRIWDRKLISLWRTAQRNRDSACGTAPPPSSPAPVSGPQRVTSRGS